MSFADDLRRFQVKVTGRSVELMMTVVPALHLSITEGSAMTGAPGQPVDTGFLKNSWQYEFAPDFATATIGTNVGYAPVIEYGLRSKYDPRGDYGVLGGQIGPAMASGGRGQRPNKAFGVRGGQVGPSESGDRITIRSSKGGIGSVRLTVANADRVLAEAVRQVTR
jgi:hypothetical protein